MKLSIFNNHKKNKSQSQLIQNLGKHKNKGKAKDFFSKLSRGLMLPISILPIAGLLLGIGGAIGANVEQTNLVALVFANIFLGMSEIVFANLPLLFAIAITITFSKDRGASGFCSALAYLVFSSSQLAFIQFNGSEIESILWFHKEIEGITTTTLGLTTLQTSIFGGVIVGGITSLLYNKFSLIKLPLALDFFSGVKLVPIVLIPSMFILSLTFLVFWPWIGQAIFFMGTGIQGTPAGTGGLLYGILGRALMPFGLHHIPIILAFQTSFGGVLSGISLSEGLFQAGVSQNDINIIMDAFTNIAGSPEARIEGDQNIWNFVNSLPFNTLISGDFEVPIFDWFNQELGVYAGRFMQDYPTYLGAVIGIGIALILVSEMRNRRNVSVVIGSSMMIAFLTGITEPLEFTFLFCAPLLYYLVFVPISGFSYMFMELAGAHVGVGFARGFIDLIIYGALPVAKGTAFYWAFPLAIAEGIFTFLVFYFSIKRFDLATPGRKDNPIGLISKKEYKEIKGSKIDERILNIIKYLGGKNNIKDVSACATRLRVTVENSKNIDSNNFIKLGSKGSIIKDKSLQIIFGGEASIISDKINDYLENDEIIIKKNNSNAIKENKYNLNHELKKIKIYAPFNGEVITLENVPDDAFKTKMVGDGIALKPTSFVVSSILQEGYLANIFPTKHAYIFKAINGTDILLHLGIDTANSNNKLFLVTTKTGPIIKNTEILKINAKEFSLEKSTISPIVIPDMNNKKIILNVKNNQKVKSGDLLYTVIG